eukprot:3149508-Prorocentrum_lima.AAC.1
MGHQAKQGCSQELGCWKMGWARQQQPQPPCSSPPKGGTSNKHKKTETKPPKIGLKGIGRG